jgi:hypothetical protein
MKKLLLILITLGLFGCYSDEKTIKTIKWIKNADKPITCRKGAEATDAISWTLIDAKGDVHRSGRTLLNLPDTIK